MLNLELRNLKITFNKCTLKKKPWYQNNAKQKIQNKQLLFNVKDKYVNTGKIFSSNKYKQTIDLISCYIYYISLLMIYGEINEENHMRECHLEYHLKNEIYFLRKALFSLEN